MNKPKIEKKKIFAGISRSCALAAALTLCGCGDGGAASSKAGYEPLASQGATAVLAVNLDKETAFKIVDVYAANMLPLLDLGSGKLQEIKEKIAGYKQDPFRDTPKEFRSFLDASGLRDAAFRWVVVSFEGASGFSLKEINWGGISWVFATDADIDKVVATAEKYLAEEGDDDVKFEKIEIDGRSAWHVVPAHERSAKDMLKLGLDPYIMSLDGKLVILAYSRDTLDRQLRLYLKGEENGDALGDFTGAAGDFAHLRIPGIGKMIAKNTSARDLRPVSKKMPGGDEILKRLKNLELEIKVDANGFTRQTISLAAGSNDDAEQIRAYVNGLLTAAKIGISREPNIPKEVKSLVSAVKVEAAGDVVQVKNADVIMVVAGSLFPAISSAMSAAQTSAAAMNGRNLFIGIVQANVDRIAVGLDNVWPHTFGGASGNSNDIADKAFSSAKDYFEELFDMVNYGTDAWAPYVDVDTKYLGKDVVKGKTLNIDGIDWCIAANVTDAMPDIVPVLVSANFNPAYLLDKWDGRTDAKKPLPIGPDSGASKTLFGDKAVVIVCKGGAAKVIKKKDLNYETIYERQYFDTTTGGHPIMYLTPKGTAKPTGGK